MHRLYNKNVLLTTNIAPNIFSLIQEIPLVTILMNDLLYIKESSIIYHKFFYLLKVFRLKAKVLNLEIENKNELNLSEYFKIAGDCQKDTPCKYDDGLGQLSYKGCNLNDGQSCFHFAELVEVLGYSTLPQRRKFLNKSCLLNNELACFEYAFLTTEDEHEELLKKACILGNKKGCYFTNILTLKKKQYY